ncbi:hypothetical protein L6452_33002 [Arctium lappa]|uniref:Uncharacterized protein n=1 Tax=Arctium lappa TaxID=4217 RepID=A0ACB8Z636_ARCLA|nr:hypothetical protein L6452_33002 [Arctium lappa]
MKEEVSEHSVNLSVNPQPQSASNPPRQWANRTLLISNRQSQNRCSSAVSTLQTPIAESLLLSSRSRLLSCS